MNLMGPRVKRKIVVLESDDWGSVRMPSRAVYEILKKKGYPLDTDVYSRYDTLESYDDLQRLSEMLLKHKDSKGRTAAITMNFNMFNPDFDRIEASGCQQYYHRPFWIDFSERNNREAFRSYSQGIESGVFRPQLHGGEHINVNRWFNALINGEDRMLDAVKHRVLSFPKNKINNGRSDYLDSFGLFYQDAKLNDRDILKDAATEFQEFFGFTARTFIAPCYTWHPSLEGTLKEIGIEAIQGKHVQLAPSDDLSDPSIKVLRHYFGEKNKIGIYYLLRNVYFEPTEHPAESGIDNVIDQVRTAFTYGKPATIQTHRLNYVGGINKKNRNQNIELLNELLTRLRETFPNLEFMGSDELIDLLNQKNGN